LNIKRKNLDLGDAAMLATALIWASNNVIMKAYVERIGAVPYVFGRFLIVSILLFALLRLRRVDLSIRRSDIPRFLFTGITGYAIYNLLFTVGLSHTSAFSVAVLVGLGPMFTLVFTAVLKIERVRPLQWGGVGLAMLGVTIFVGDKLVGSSPAIGDIMSIIAASIFGIYTLSTRPLVRTYGAPVVTAWSALIGLIASLPITLPPVIEHDWTAVGAKAWAALFYSAAISMLVAYTLWGWAVERKGIGRTVPYLYLVPLLTGGMAVLFLGEHLTIVMIIGSGLVLAGVGLARRSISIVSVEPVAESPVTPGVASASAD